MKEYVIELTDYFRVIWKRKILILVGTLVCMVAGGVVSLRKPKTYRAEAIINIGNKVNSPSPYLHLSPSPSPSLAILDTPDHLTKSIPAEYGLNDEEETLKYPLKVEVVRGPLLIKIIQEGPDRRRVEELLKGAVNRLIDDHLRKKESSIQPYRNFIGKLETDIKIIQKNIAQMEVQLENMNIEKTDPVAVVMLQNALWERETDLRNIQQSLLLYRSVVDRLKEYKTKVIGGISEATIIPSTMKRNVKFYGIGGLMMILFLVLFTEHLRKESGKNED